MPRIKHRANKSTTPSRQQRTPPPPPPPVENLRFLNEARKEKYHKVFENRKINPGKSIDEPLFGQYNLLEPFNSNNLINIVRFNHRYYPTLIRQFYANLTYIVHDDGYTIKSLVSSSVIQFSQTDLYNILGIPNRGREIPTIATKTWVSSRDDDDYSIAEQVRIVLDDPNAPFTSKPQGKDLPPKVHIAHRVLCSNIIPRGGHLTDVTFVELYILAYMFGEKHFNFSNLIMRLMINAATTKRPILPFGSILTPIFQSCGVSFMNSTSIGLHPINDVIGRDNFRRMGLEVVGNEYRRSGAPVVEEQMEGGEEEVEAGDDDEEEEREAESSDNVNRETRTKRAHSPHFVEQSQAGPSGSTRTLDDLFDFVSIHFDNINKRLDDFDTRLTQIQESSAQLSQDFYTRYHGNP